jgi:hypothetical protein
MLMSLPIKRTERAEMRRRYVLLRCQAPDDDGVQKTRGKRTRLHKRHHIDLVFKIKIYAY